MTSPSVPAGLRNEIEAWPAPPPAALYFSELVAPRRALCWLVDFDADTVDLQVKAVSPLGPAGVRNPVEFGSETVVGLATDVLRFASRPFVTAATDVPAFRPVEARYEPATVERSLQVGPAGFFSPLAAADAGEVALRNEDGALDGLGDGAVVDGRAIRLSVAALAQGPDGQDLDPKLGDFGRMFQGTIGSLSFDRRGVRFQVSDDRLRFGRAVQVAAYAGGGGIDGPADLAGTTKPLAYGRCLNVAPALVDPYALIYQFHDGEARAVDAVYDRGVPLAFHASADSYEALAAIVQVDPVQAGPADFTVGKYAAAPKIGCFRLGGLPAGRVTADVRGHGGKDGPFEYWSDGTLWSDGTGWDSGGGTVHARTAPEVAITLLQRAEVGEVNVAQFRQLDEEEPREVGLYLEPGGARTLADCLEPVLNANGCFLMRSGDGAYQLRRFAGPAETPLLAIGEESVAEGTLERVPLPWRQPWSQWRVLYARNWTPMTDSDLAGAVPADQRTFLRRRSSQALAVDGVAAAVFPARAPGVLDTVLAFEADAQAQAARMLDVYGPDRALFRLRCKGASFRVDLGDTVRLTHPRFGLAAGRHLVVVGVREGDKAGQTGLTLFG